MTRAILTILPGYLWTHSPYKKNCYKITTVTSPCYSSVLQDGKNKTMRVYRPFIYIYSVYCASTLKRPSDPVEDKENVPVTSKQRLSNSCYNRGSPAYRAMVLRKQKRKPVEVKTVEEETVVVVTDDPMPPESEKVVIHVSNVRLYERYFDILHSKRE